jgi:hypothetical protein
MRRVLLVGVALLACAAPAHAALPVHAGHPILPAAQSVRTPQLREYRNALVELDHVRGAGATFVMRQAGGRLIDPQLSLWQLPSTAAARMLPGLRAASLVRSVTPDLPLRPQQASRSLSFCTDQFCPQEWWIHAVGADVWTPPGPGAPVTMIDSGVDLSHPEFAGRPNTTPLDTQTFTATEEELHGTATASVVGAQANGDGHGIEGIYPQAKMQIWDASPGGVLTVGGEISGLASAVAHGPGVINLSLGGPDRLTIEEHAILAAFGTGSLVVASAGNDREDGSPRSFPASFAHVLTVGATDESNRATYFSSASPDMDLAAPGQDMLVAVPLVWNPTGTMAGYLALDGTSFSAPLVSGAAAAVWTVRPTLSNTQLFEVMRRSAHRVGGRGWNRDTGYGILDVNTALARKAPATDPQEPNEDVYLVKPNGLFRAGHPPLTAPARPRRVLAAHLEQGDDPEDVYRAYLPAKGRLTVTVRPGGPVDLEVWGRRTRSVFERGAAAKRDLLGLSAHRRASKEQVVVHGRGSGQYVYLDVILSKKAREAGYTVSVSSARR